MTKALCLQEYEVRHLRLSAEQAAALSARFSHAVELRPSTPGLFRVRARQWVGSVVLPGLELRIEPKCPVSNLFFMLSYAHDLARLRRELTGHERTDQIWDFLVAVLINQVEELVRRGLCRGYVEQERELRALRGRLLVGQMLRRPSGREPTLPCRYEELTSDLPHNQVIRYTLRTLTPPSSVLLRRRLRRLEKLFASVRLVPVLPSDLDELSYDRLTAHYEPIHRVCRVLLEARGLDSQSGAYPLGCYLIDMNAVFERFVAGWLRQNLPRELRLSAQWTGHLDRKRQVGIRPDIVLQDRRGRPTVVADTKYKRVRGGEQGKGKSGISSSDAYQVLAYCRALGVHSGMLIYPSWRRAPVAAPVQDRANTIVVDGLDISLPRESIEKALKGLMARLVRLGNEPPAGV